MEIPSAVSIVQVKLVRERRPRLSQVGIVTPEIAADLFRQFLKGVDREYFLMLALSSKNRALALNVVSIGNVDSAIVHPREVFKPAVILGAASIMVAHNHPSGDPEPSPEDKAVTIRLVRAGVILGIDLLDHIILGEGCHISLRELGQIRMALDAAKADQLAER